jgi:ribosomal protein L29
MKTSIKKELHAKTINELKKQLGDAYEEIRVLRLNHTMGKLKSPKAIGGKREEIAVVKTIIKEKLLNEKIKDISEKQEGGKK